MNDAERDTICERLRQFARYESAECGGGEIPPEDILYWRAADEIEALREQLADAEGSFFSASFDRNEVARERDALRARCSRYEEALREMPEENESGAEKMATAYHRALMYLFTALPWEQTHRWGGDLSEFMEGVLAASSSSEKDQL